MSETRPPCCPDKSIPSKSATEAGFTEALKGSYSRVPYPEPVRNESDFRVYVTQPSDRNGDDKLPLVVVFHDLFGFDTGRTHGFCDRLAQGGYVVVAPDWYGQSLSSSELTGWKYFKTLMHVMTLLKSPSKSHQRLRIPWKEIESKLVDVVIPYAGNEFNADTERVCALGFCWGGWATFRACSNSAIKCGVTLHPSPICQSLQRNDPLTKETIMDHVNAPMLILPANNDASSLKEDGSVIKTLRAKPFGDKCIVHTYKDMQHGYGNRGDLRDPKVKQVVDDAFERTFEFLKVNL